MLHPIFALILCGNLVEVATLIKHDPQAIRVKHNKWFNASPLIYASSKGRIKICKLLLNNGASVEEVDDWKATALHWSCLEGKGRLQKKNSKKKGFVQKGVSEKDQIWNS